MLADIRLLKQEQQLVSPILVHCSAGVGMGWDVYCIGLTFVLLYCQGVQGLS